MTHNNNTGMNDIIKRILLFMGLAKEIPFVNHVIDYENHIKSREMGRNDPYMPRPITFDPSSLESHNCGYPYKFPRK